MSDIELQSLSDQEQHDPEQEASSAAGGAAGEGQSEQPAPARPDAQPPSVRIVGSGDGIVVRIGDQSGQWDEAVDLLSLHLEQADGFFQGQEMALDVGARSLDAGAFDLIREMLATHRVKIADVRTSNPDTKRAAEECELPATFLELTAETPDPEIARREAAHRWEVVLGESGSVRSAVQQAAEFEPPQAIADALAAEVGEPEIAALRQQPATDELSPPEGRDEQAGEEAPRLVLAAPYLYRGSLRSGQIFRHAGPIIILGDVNPGAEVISGGDVFVWGRLRGMVHAGAMGDETALVAALDFEPVQVRIAGYIAMSPKGTSEEPGRWFWKRSAVGKPEVARLVGGQIVVDTWDAH